MGDDRGVAADFWHGEVGANVAEWRACGRGLELDQDAAVVERPWV